MVIIFLTIVVVVWSLTILVSFVEKPVNKVKTYKHYQYEELTGTVDNNFVKDLYKERGHTLIDNSF